MGQPAPSLAGSGRQPDSLPVRGERQWAQSRKIDLQRGSAAMALLAILMIALATLIISATSAERLNVERQQKTALALGAAHDALVAYAVSVQPDTHAKRPGDLPCPDLDNDGDAELTCTDVSQRLGRLPWKTLKLADLRDGDGERLWYALSTNFKRSTFNQCPVAGGPSCLNSDTPGTLTVRDSTGAIVHDGANPSSGAVAVIIAAGPVLTRLGETSAQDRGCTGDADVAACERTERCSSAATARCKPANYLDVAGPPLQPVPGARNLTEDNAAFSDAATNDGFIAGPIVDRDGRPIVNDTVRVLRYEDLMPQVEQRVAREALKCLQDYAADTALGRGRYVWAAPVSADYTAPLSDSHGLSFGRLPQTLGATEADSSGPMSGGWPSSCPIAADDSAKKWWNNWKNLVFYAVAPSYAPGTGAPVCGACLTVAAETGTVERHVAVFVAGRALGPWQHRGVGANATHYLEDLNARGGLPGWTSFKRDAVSASFNDVLAYN